MLMHLSRKNPGKEAALLYNGFPVFYRCVYVVCACVAWYKRYGNTTSDSMDICMDER